MTREKLRQLKVLFCDPSQIGIDGDFCDVIKALESAWAELDAWRSCGLTEEMLRNGDGCLKINRGIVLVSEHYLEEVQAATEAWKQTAHQVQLELMTVLGNSRDYRKVQDNLIN